MKLTRIDRLVNVFPVKKFTCIPCNFVLKEKQGRARFSKREYGGPFCPKCGNKFK